MNHHIVPEFNMEDHGYSIPTSSDCFFDQHLKMPEEELVELLWQNGQVVMHNQTQRLPRKTPVRFYNGDGSAVLHHVLPDKSAAEDGDGDGGCGAGPSSAPGQLLHIQEDEMASWLQYPIDDSFDRDFCSDFFYPPAGSCPPVARAAEASSSSPKPKVPPIPQPDADKVAANFTHFSLLTGKAPQVELPRVSTSTATKAAPPPADREVGGGDSPVTSSSGGFRDWPSNAPAANDRKRQREGDELEGQKERRLWPPPPPVCAPTPRCPSPARDGRASTNTPVSISACVPAVGAFRRSDFDGFALGAASGEALRDAWRHANDGFARFLYAAQKTAERLDRRYSFSSRLASFARSAASRVRDLGLQLKWRSFSLDFRRNWPRCRKDISGFLESTIGKGSTTIFLLWFAFSGWLFRCIILATWVLPFAAPLLIGAVANKFVIEGACPAYKKPFMGYGTQIIRCTSCQSIVWQPGYASSRNNSRWPSGPDIIDV